MRNAVAIADGVIAVPDTSDRTSLARLEQSAHELRELQEVHRQTTLASVASGTTSADAAMARVDTVRRLERIAHHAWRTAAHLLGQGA